MNMQSPFTKGHSLQSGEGYKIEKAVTINRPISELYAFWRDFDNLPQFMKPIKSMTTLPDGLTHWVLETKKGKHYEWDAQIIEEKRDELISWQSLPDSEIHNAGSVRFTPAVGNRGTVVRISLKYANPNGKIAGALAKVFGNDPATYMAESLLRFKNLMETGEMPTIDGQSKGS